MDNPAKNCIWCGAALRTGARFCSCCGKAVVDIYCSACGEKLEWGDNFCMYCGAPVKKAEAEAPKTEKNGDEYPAWQNFAALWDVGSVLSTGAGSTEEHYLAGRSRSEIFRIDADGIKGEYIPNPEDVVGFMGKQWKNGKLWLSALMKVSESSTKLYALFSYTRGEGFKQVLNISGEEYGDLEIAGFIAAEKCIFLYCYNSRRRENCVSLMTCGFDGSGLRELWRGEDFVLRGAGEDRLFMIGANGRGEREAIIVTSAGNILPAAEVLSKQIPLIARELGAEPGETAEERGDFCWKYIPFIDFAEGMVYAALDEGGTENLTRRLWCISMNGDELRPCGEKWRLGDIDPTENFREYFDGEKAVGFCYGNPGSWTVIHADGSRVDLGEGSYWDSGAVLGDWFYLDCCSSDPGTWYKISLKDGSRRKIEF